MAPNIGLPFFIMTKARKKIAEKVKDNAQKSHENKIVTEIVPYTNFYEAENYHENYYDKNRSLPYCQLVIDPKIQNCTKIFGSDLKKED